jgi:drug/metabolite transporter (DMT)-like permease
MLISSLILFAFTGATGTGVNFVNSSNFMVVHCLPCIIGSILSFIAYIYMLQNLPAEINSIYAYINPIVAVLLGALIFGEAYNGDRNWSGITIFGLYMVNHSIRKARRLALKRFRRPFYAFAKHI